MFRISSLVVTALAFAAMPASAATILNAVPTSGGIVVGAVAAGDNLTNNGPFSSGTKAKKSTAYVLDEGSSVLLHFDQGGRPNSSSSVSGSFQILLGASETFLGFVSDTAGLLSSDPSNGAFYQTAPGYATDNRGLELAATDVLSISHIGKLYTIAYNLTTSYKSLDEGRFLIGAAPVPEAATWAMLIAGFTLAGGMIRHRRAKPSVMLS